MASITWKIDSGEVDQLLVDLTGAPARVQFKSLRVLKNLAGPKLAHEMQTDASHHTGNWFGIAGTEYITPTPPASSEAVGPLSVEAGIDKRGSGKLMHILAYGSVNNGPAYDPSRGVRRSMYEIRNWLADAAAESVLGND